MKIQCPICWSEMADNSEADKECPVCGAFLECWLMRINPPYSLQVIN